MDFPISRGSFKLGLDRYAPLLIAVGARSNYSFKRTNNRTDYCPLNSGVRPIMQELPSLNDVVTWIEAHDTTVDALKWLLIILFAWFVGVFRFVRTKLKRPSLEIEELTSRCTWEYFDEHEGNKDSVRAILLIEAGINNPTTDPIVIRDFTISIKRQKRWPIWHYELNAVTLPNRPRLVVGGLTKLLKNWFSNFADGPETLTLHGRIESRDFQSGYLLFVSFSWGYMIPRVVDKAIPVKLRARLTTGETLVARARIRIMDDHSAFEAMIPGIYDHVQHASTWNIIRGKS